MITLELNIASNGDDRHFWDDYMMSLKRLSFPDYLKWLDDNIIDGAFIDINHFMITFKDEQSKLFFILKYS